MRLAVTAWIGVLATLLLQPGCASCRHRSCAREIEAKSTIFNPESTQIPSYVMGRTDWPQTYSHEGHREDTEYEVRIIDWQGTFFHDRDRYYRRFDSSRIGRYQR